MSMSRPVIRCIVWCPGMATILQETLGMIAEVHMAGRHAITRQSGGDYLHR